MRIWGRSREKDSDESREEPGSCEQNDESEPEESEKAGEAHASGSHEEAVAEESRGFFELEPEEISSWKQPWPTIAVRRQRNVKPVLRVTAAVLMVGALIAVIVLIWPSSRARVPGLEGKDLASAMNAARRSSFRPLVTSWVFSFKHSDGVIVSQDPLGGRVVPKGSRISLTVSKGRGSEAGQNPAGTTPDGQSQPQPGTPGSAPTFSIAGKTICVDPGGQSGGYKVPEWTDPGMTGKKLEEGGTRTGVETGNVEHLVNLDIGLKLKSLLEKEGINVVMTRESGDVDISSLTRAEIANNADADLLVSIWCGYSTDINTGGTATLYPARNRWTDKFYEKSKSAAIYLQQEVIKSCGTPDLGIAPREEASMFTWARVPVVMPVPAYLSNLEEDRLLSEDDFRWKVAWGLRNGIIKYLNNP